MIIELHPSAEIFISPCVSYPWKISEGRQNIMMADPLLKHKLTSLYRLHPKISFFNPNDHLLEAHFSSMK